jgi:lysophospholipase L1-like esterase
MQPKNIRWAVRGILATATLGLVFAAPLSASTQPSKHPHPGKHLYVLALGDSVTAGVQPLGPQTVFGGSPDQEISRSGEGYADQLVASLRAKGMKVTLVNLACNRETTQSMIDGTGSLCTYRHGSQLAEALRFLHAHRKHTLAVVMSLGAADAFFPCNPLDAACYADRFATASANLETILGALRAEGGGVPIATLNYYDPFLAAWVFPALGGPPVALASVPLLADPAGQFIQTAYGPFGVTIIDTQALLQTADFIDMTTIPVFGPVPVNVANICTYTWICTWGDLHPNVAGYGLIAQAFENALGL